MRLNWMNNMVMDEATDGTQGGGNGGGTGNGSFLTPSAGGGGTQADPANASPAPGTDPGKAPGNASTNPSAGGNASSDWRSQLPQGLQEDPSIKKFNTVDALAGAYLNAQRHLGSDKIPVPGKHATEDDWKQVYHKLGLPESLDKYEVKFKEGITLDEDFAKQFKEMSFKSGVLPQQAQKLAEWFSDVNLQSEQKLTEMQTKTFNESKARLEKDWGQGFQVKMARGIKVVEDFGGKEILEHFNKSGIGADEKFVRFLAAVGDKLYAEHNIVNESGNITTGKTPDEIKKTIAQLQTEKAYFDKMHPNHKTVVKEVQDLYQELYPSKK